MGSIVEPIHVLVPGVAVHSLWADVNLQQIWIDLPHYISFLLIYGSFVREKEM